jgi:hypothetical protein
MNNNQEDSIIINKSAVDRGLFRATAYKKYVESLNKNSSSSQNDIFMKPNRNKVQGMKDANYEKLNERGFVPEGTVLNDGDVLIGLVSPIQPNNANDLVFKDNSTIYKSLVPGTVDKVFSGIYNNDGYEMLKQRIRSERIPTTGDKFCLPPDHEVLTDAGWITMDKLTMQHKVASLVDGNKLVYVNPTEVQCFKYDSAKEGKMYKINSNQVDLIVTPNHKMYVSPRVVKDKVKGFNFSLEKASDIFNKIRFYKKNAEEYPVVKPATYIRLPAYEKQEAKLWPLNDWLIMFGIWIAEGCLHGKYSVTFATHKERVKEVLKPIFDRQGYKIQKYYDRKEDGDKGIRNIWEIADKQLVNYFQQYNVGAVNKFLPQWAWKLTQDQARLLIHGMMLGDGHTMKNGTRRYDTSSVRLADDFQRLCLHAGWSTNIALKDKAGSEHAMIGGKVIKTTVDAWRLTIIETQNHPEVNRHGKPKMDEWVDYKGNVYCCTVPSNIFYVRHNKYTVWTGNSSRAGQKATCGALLPGYDMPFSSRGVTPDIIINPNCIPKRMTFGQLKEGLVAKAGVIKGELCDGSPFIPTDLNKVNQVLKDAGYEHWGNEILYNGMTGEQIQAEIFLVPTYYQRLKHMVDDKMHSRARGPVQLLTRSPTEGRSRQGGLRFGEMERDAVCAHGAAQFLKERLVDVSDKYTAHICDICGNFASKMKEHEVYICLACDNNTKVSTVEIPYILKLFAQELMGMNIMPAIRTSKSLTNRQ